MSDELYCGECGFALDPQCLCKIPRRKKAPIADDVQIDLADAAERQTGIRPSTSHLSCSHEKTKAARAACRKARQGNPV